MKLKVIIDKTCTESTLIVTASEMTTELKQAINLLTQATIPSFLLGYKEDKVEILGLKDIIRIYAMDKKVYAETSQAAYQLKQRLYELENELSQDFVRISNSEIVNLKYIKKLDLSLSGTICVYLAKDKVTYASRRYVSKLKKILGI